MVNKNFAKIWKSLHTFFLRLYIWDKCLLVFGTRKWQMVELHPALRSSPWKSAQKPCIFSFPPKHSFFMFTATAPLILQPNLEHVQCPGSCRVLWTTLDCSPLNGSQNGSCLSHLLSSNSVLLVVDDNLVDLFHIGAVVKGKTEVGVLLQRNTAVRKALLFPRAPPEGLAEGLHRANPNCFNWKKQQN